MIVGGSLTGNKGAASMLLGIVDGIRSAPLPHPLEITVLSPLATEDASLSVSEGVELADFGPQQILLAGAGACLARLTRGRISGGPAVRAIRRAGVVADVSGISFVDGRSLVTLCYNVLLLVPALLLGVPVVKISQAMGPFRTAPNRRLARFVLPRLAGLLARGAKTQAHLDELGAPGDGTASDAGFLMRVADEDETWAEAQVQTDRPTVAVSPSQVVEDQARPAGIEYVGLVVELIDDLSRDHHVILVPHSARPGRPAERLNDLPLCRQVMNRVASPDRCTMAPATATPRQMRALIARCRLLVASRFHAMISALATGTPVLVVGWSHKYREVLAEFGLELWAFDFRAAEGDAAIASARELLDSRLEVAEQIASNLPRVLSHAQPNVDLLLRHLHP